MSPRSCLPAGSIGGDQRTCEATRARASTDPSAAKDWAAGQAEAIQTHSLTGRRADNLVSWEEGRKHLYSQSTF